MFGLGKKDGGAPPDVGKEDAGEEVSGGIGSAAEDDDKDSSSVKAPSVSSGGESVSLGGADMEKVNARMDSVIEWIKQFYDRFSYMNESIGEIRNMAMTNEKSILQASAGAEKVVAVVKDVKPEELRMDYQKLDLKVSSLLERIEANAQAMNDVRTEMNDLQKKSEAFIGTESLMKLNEDTKKDLVEVQKLSSRVKLQADKSQEIFNEVRKGFAESQKTQGMIDNLDGSYAGLRESLEKLKLSHDKVVRQKDYEDFKKTYGNKLAVFDALVSDVESLKGNVDEFSNLVETSLSVGRINKEDIAKIAVAKGVSNVKGVDEYENQIADMVGIIEVLSKQVAEVRKKLGLSKNKKVVPVAKDSSVAKAVPVIKKAVIPVIKNKPEVIKKSVEVKPKIVLPPAIEKVKPKVVEEKSEDVFDVSEEVSVGKKVKSKKIHIKKKKVSKKSSVKKSSSKKKVSKKSSSKKSVTRKASKKHVVKKTVKKVPEKHIVKKVPEKKIVSKDTSDKKSEIDEIVFVQSVRSNHGVSPVERMVTEKNDDDDSLLFDI